MCRLVGGGRWVSGKVGRWVVADPFSGLVLGSTIFLTDGILGFFFPDLSSDTVHGLFTTDPSSGQVQGSTIFLTDGRFGFFFTNDLSSGAPTTGFPLPCKI